MGICKFRNFYVFGLQRQTQSFGRPHQFCQIRHATTIDNREYQLFTYQFPFFLVTMDSWNEKQIKSMQNSGNDKFNQFISQYGVQKLTSIPVKYNTPAAKLYKDRYVASFLHKYLVSTILCH